MQLLDGRRNNRILVVDDNDAIHADFEKILRDSAAGSRQVDDLAASLFGEVPTVGPQVEFSLTHALQGQEALDLVLRSLEAGLPYAMAFVDVRMPPGWNGVETVEKIWSHDREIEIVLCTAYSDFSWEEISTRLTQPDRLLILRKPFDPLEVRQLAYGLTSKWFLRRQAACRMQDLELMVQQRIKELEALRARLAEVTAQQHARAAVG
jgi:CheY-like chemotaxis protein